MEAGVPLPPSLLSSGFGWLSFQLVLYLHLHGSNSNSLNIYSQTEEGFQLVWSRTGDLGNYWFREKVDFLNTKNFKVDKARRPWCQVPEPPRLTRAVGGRWRPQAPALSLTLYCPASTSLVFLPDCHRGQDWKGAGREHRSRRSSSVS